MTWATFSKWPTYSAMRPFAKEPRAHPPSSRPVWMTANTAATVQTFRFISSRVRRNDEQRETAKQSAQRDIPTSKALIQTFMA